MKKLLIIVDVQNDFVDGALGTKEAVAMIPNLVKRIETWDGDIVCTRDTHYGNYMETNEGKHLPVLHCIEGTEGHMINQDVLDAFERSYKNFKVFNKTTFASMTLAEYVQSLDYDYVELVGLCTDICVVSNALMIKAYCPEAEIVIDASCCAGVTPESHVAALTTMKMCQIEVVGE